MILMQVQGRDEGGSLKAALDTIGGDLSSEISQKLLGFVKEIGQIQICRKLRQETSPLIPDKHRPIMDLTMKNACNFKMQRNRLSISASKKGKRAGNPE